MGEALPRRLRWFGETCEGCVPPSKHRQLSVVGVALSFGSAVCPQLVERICKDAPAGAAVHPGKDCIHLAGVAKGVSSHGRALQDALENVPVLPNKTGGRVR